MIFRLLIKSITPIVAGSILVGWANLDGSPAARTMRAVAFGSASCGSCKRGTGPAAFSQPVPHKQKTKPVVLSANEVREIARHAAPQRGGAP